MRPEGTAGWIDGEPFIVFQRCTECNRVWYFRRAFCPGCGHDQPLNCHSKGTGTVHTMSLVHRAPSADLRDLVPYLLLIVDVDEGFRLMAHGEQSLAIGDRVQAHFVEFAGRIIPRFEKYDN